MWGRGMQGALQGSRDSAGSCCLSPWGISASAVSPHALLCEEAARQSHPRQPLPHYSHTTVTSDDDGALPPLVHTQAVPDAADVAPAAAEATVGPRPGLASAAAQALSALGLGLGRSAGAAAGAAASKATLGGLWLTVSELLRDAAARHQMHNLMALDLSGW